MHACIHRFTWLRYISVCIYPSCVWVDAGKWVGAVKYLHSHGFL